MEKLILREDFIKLGQALKAAGVAASGADAKELILLGQVKVNGEVETRRGRKLYGGDQVEIKGHFLQIEPQKAG